MVEEETTSFPEFCPTRGGHGVGGVRGGWYMNLGAQSLKNFGGKKFLVPKQLPKHIFGPKKICVKKKLGLKKNLGQKKGWV